MHLHKIYFAILIFGILLFQGSFAYAEENPSESPFTIGAQCDVTDTSYGWDTLTRTKWSIDMVYSLPTDLTDPEEWSSVNAYRSEMATLLNGENDASRFANACLIAWPDFTSSWGNLVVRFVRQISRTNRIVTCVNSVWIIESNTLTSQTDYSDWLDVGEQPHSYSQTSSTEISDTIQDLLDHLNSQPGSDVTPSHGFAPVQ